jgi:AbiU2
MIDVYEQLMGPDLGKIFSALGNELSTLSAIYDDCIFLFGDGNEDRLAFLNDAAPAFFGRTQMTFERELMLGICRITDPVKSMGKDNLTVHRLEELVSPLKPGSVDELKAKVLAAQSASEFAKDPRNRWLAHRSLDLAISEPTAKPLDSSTYGKIDCALTALNEVLQTVDKAFGGNGNGYRNLSGSTVGGSYSLFRTLKIGSHVDKTAVSRFISGIPTEEDIALYKDL